MDQRTLLKPPPHNRPSAAPSTPQNPRLPPAPVSAHPSAIISESAMFQGTYPISIGRGAVLHPRARLFSTEGPIKIGEGSIVSEKAVIGSPPAPGGYGGGGEKTEGMPITISANVTIGPLAVVRPGVHLHSGVVVESHAVINRGVDIGGHSKICARCEVAQGAKIKEWVVVWGVGKGFGLRRRVRAQGKVVSPVVFGAGEPVLEGRVIEDARLMVLRKEREALGKFIPQTAGKRK
ncbi:trimeric LpxA-like protein [Aspergillus californicus]